MDPYYGVLTAPQYRREQLDSERRKQFFATGRRQLEAMLTTAETLLGTAPAGERALDFGCGVGRLTLPLARRHSHVYGVDVSPSMLDEARANAAREGIGNVEWLLTDRLEQLGGHYDLVVSAIVFQHIPVREGERIFELLVRGLRPGGVGLTGFTVGRAHPFARSLRWVRKYLPLAANVVNIARGLAWSHPYMEVNSYSLSRLGALLADNGISEWHVSFRRSRKWQGLHTATLVFRKP